MPYPRGPATVTRQTYNNEITALLPTGVDAPAAGDLILILINGARSVPAVVEFGTSAYTVRNAASIGGTARLAFAYKIAAGGDANPVFRANDGSSCEWSAQVIVIRDFDATTPIDVSGTGYLFGTFSAMPCTFGASLSAASANMMVVYALGIHENSMTVTGPLDGLQELGKTLGGNDQGPLVVGYRTKVTAGACVNETFYANATDGGTSVVITIKNSSGGKSVPEVKIDASFVDAANQFPNFYGDIGLQNGAAITWKDPADLLTGAAKSTIDSIGLHTVDPTIATNQVGYLYPWGTYTTIENSSNLSPSSLWTGGGHDFTSTVNMSGKVFSLMWYSTLGNANPNQPNTDGVCVVFKDNQATPAWVAYQLQPLVTLLATTDFQSLIACGSSAATPLDSSGTMDWTNVKGIGFFMHRKTGSAVAWALGIKNAVLLDKATILGGSAAYPASFTDLKPALDSWNHFGLVDRQASAQMQLLFDAQIGNGSDATYFDSSAQSAEYPATFSSPTTPLTQNKWNGLAGTTELSVYTSASDTVNLTATGLVTQTEQALTINPSSSISAAVSFAGSSIVGWNPTWKTGIPCSSVTFKRCAMIDFKGADLVNVIANTGTDTALMSASDGFSATGCTFAASASAIYGIRIAAAGTFDLDATTFSGFTKDIDVTATSGTVTINLAAGQATPTYQTAGATVTLVSSPVFQTVTITGFTAGSRIWIKDVTSGNVLFNGTASAGDTVISGSTCTWTDPSAASASRQIALRVAYVNAATAKVFLDVANIGTCGTSAGSEDVSYIVAQEADTTYNSNGIDGSGVADITFTDAATDLVVCNLAGGSTTYPRLYAAFVYWMFSSSGIDDDNTYIAAPDTANYLFTAMKIRNTNATPLTITGGYGRDATSGLVADIVDVAGSTGNIYPQPDHVVPFATGSGVTSQDKIDIASQVLTAAAAAPISADAKKMNGYTINGSGVSSDLWRGA